ncbi:MAG: ferritin-like domain-containing protein [Gemmatimonadaceae bacterium]
MPMESKEDLFAHGLKDLYDTEHKLKGALKKLATLSKSEPGLQKLFTNHLKETENHIKRLDSVFESIGKRPSRVPCEGINGLLKEHSEFVKEEKPKGDVLKAFNIEAALKTEHYEIVSYQGLITLAAELGNREAQSLLSQNLAEEENAARLLEREGNVRVAPEQGKSARREVVKPSGPYRERDDGEPEARM